jgi:hypothetical protein
MYVAGALVYLGGTHTQLSEALYLSELCTENLVPEPQQSAEVTPDEARCLQGLSAMIGDIMARINRAQCDPCIAATMFSRGEPTARPAWKIDNIIMDSAGCSMEYVMPCLLAALPLNLVCPGRCWRAHVDAFLCP